jgi:hypothetical protein
LIQFLNYFSTVLDLPVSVRIQARLYLITLLAKLSRTLIRNQSKAIEAARPAFNFQTDLLICLFKKQFVVYLTIGSFWTAD